MVLPCTGVSVAMVCAVAQVSLLMLPGALCVMLTVFGLPVAPGAVKVMVAVRATVPVFAV